MDVVGFDVAVGGDVVDGEFVGPASLDREQGVFWRGRVVEARGEGVSVLFATAREELAGGRSGGRRREIDLRHVAVGGWDVIRSVECRLGSTGEDAGDFNGGEGDEVVFGMGVEVEDGVAGLGDLDGGWRGVGDGLGGVAFGANAVFCVPEITCCYRRVMTAFVSTRLAIV